MTRMGQARTRWRMLSLAVAAAWSAACAEAPADLGGLSADPAGRRPGNGQPVQPTATGGTTAGTTGGSATPPPPPVYPPGFNLSWFASSSLCLQPQRSPV